MVLKDLADDATRSQVTALLARLAADPANGIEKILDAREIAGMGGWTRAALWVDMKTNFSVVETAPQVRARKVGGTYGYAPAHPELLASFFIAGPGMKAGLDMGEIDIRNVAPTLARALGLTLSTADLKALDLF